MATQDMIGTDHGGSPGRRSGRFADLLVRWGLGQGGFIWSERDCERAEGWLTCPAVWATPVTRPEPGRSA